MQVDGVGLSWRSFLLPLLPGCVLWRRSRDVPRHPGPPWLNSLQLHSWSLQLLEQKLEREFSKARNLGTSLYCLWCWSLRGSRHFWPVLEPSCRRTAYGEEPVVVLVPCKGRAQLLAGVSCFAKVDLKLKALESLAVIYVDFLRIFTGMETGTGNLIKLGVLVRVSGFLSHGCARNIIRENLLRKDLWIWDQILFSQN